MNLCYFCAQMVTLPCHSQGETEGCRQFDQSGATFGKKPIQCGINPPRQYTYRRPDPPKTEWLKGAAFKDATRGKIYLMGSLRNPLVKEIGQKIREKLNCEVFDDWSAAPPDADDAWKVYEEGRGRTYVDALKGYAAQQVFQFDLKHLDESTAGLLVLPAGRSAHMELGYLKGAGKRAVILLDGEYDRWDVMYNFADAVVTNVDDACKELKPC